MRKAANLQKLMSSMLQSFRDNTRRPMASADGHFSADEDADAEDALQDAVNSSQLMSYLDTTSPNLSQVLHVFAKFMKDKRTAYFRQPDPSAYYAERINYPMDLGVIQRSLMDGDYTQHGRISRLSLDVDVEYIWSNCIRFHGPDHARSQLARQLRRKLRKNWIR